MTTSVLSVQRGSRLTASRPSATASHTASACTDGEALTRELVLEKYDPDFTGTTLDLRRGAYLADCIYALDDPWRSRFVDLIARRVNGGADDGHATGRTQLAIWLADQSLARMIRLMLGAWMHEP
ncbi:MAG: hypothetical protein JXC32_15220 [Anaerolineae bacterium]|nr:hypothetical protein [Anaerolineae bacterium]